MANGASIPLYLAPEKHLSQGDIFCCHLLGTYGGTNLTILREDSGDRPSAKFTSVGGVKFLKAAEVNQYPISQEIVSCPVEHLSHFMLASQTCDVAGDDHSALPTCLVLKMTTFCDFVSGGELPFKWQEGKESIIKQIALSEFLFANLDKEGVAALKKVDNDQGAYPGALREALKAWKPKANSNEHTFKSKLQNFLTDITNNKEGRTYYLPADAKFKIPEGFVDLTAVFPVNTDDVQASSGSRLATLANPYKEDFSQRLGVRFSRVAMPVPVRGEKFG
jgi:hypothetical protein